MEGHVFYHLPGPPGSGNKCSGCGRGPGDPIHLAVFAGMDQAVEDQARSAAETAAEELTAEMRKPLGNINAKAGRMEEESPLFYGKVNPTLF